MAEVPELNINFIENAEIPAELAESGLITVAIGNSENCLGILVLKRDSF